MLLIILPLKHAGLVHTSFLQKSNFSAFLKSLFPFHKIHSKESYKLKTPKYWLILEEGFYNSMTQDAISIKIMQLSLTLVELIQICSFKTYSSMWLINLKTFKFWLIYLHSEFVLDSLDCQILSHRTELLVNVSLKIISFFEFFKNTCNQLLYFSTYFI